MLKADAADRLVDALDTALRTLFAEPQASRALPLPPASGLDPQEERHAAGLMRVNHAGEIAAQGLYRGQMLLARNDATYQFLRQAAQEETDHLAWCAQRLQELKSRPSLLNPLWYAGSFAIGAAAAVLGDRWSLGFVDETERQVEGHLAGHQHQLPVADERSRAIVEQMRVDEAGHGSSARARGAAALPAPIPKLMAMASRVMTTTAYRF